MKRGPFAAAASLAPLMASHVVSSPGYAQDQTLPQDNNYSERPLGCEETVTPSTGGNELGGYHQARHHRAGIPVTARARRLTPV